MKGRLAIIAVAAVLAAGTTPVQAADAPATLGLGVCYVKAKSVDATVFFGGDFRFPLHRHLAFSPEVTYWKKTIQLVGVASSVKDLQFGINVMGLFHPTAGLEIFAGGGGGIHQIGG